MAYCYAMSRRLHDSEMLAERDIHEESRSLFNAITQSHWLHEVANQWHGFL